MYLTGSGMIAGHQFRCVAPDWIVKFATGYPLDKTDFLDVKRLCEKFEIECPTSIGLVGIPWRKISSEARPPMIMMPIGRRFFS
jgi:hypothetical protein